MNNRRVVTALIMEGKSYQQVADKLGVTRQRIQQLNKPAKETLARLVERANGKCENCGEVLTSGHAHHISNNVSYELYQELSNLLYLCISCHLKVGTNRPLPRMLKICVCGKNFSHNKMFCSRKCWINHHSTDLICCVCGKEFRIRKSEYNARCRRHKTAGFYCSKRCAGKMAGKLYGWHAQAVARNLNK